MRKTDGTPKGILIFNQNLRDFRLLSDEQAGKAVKAMAAYYLDGEEDYTGFDAITEMMYRHLIDNVEWSCEQYRIVCERNRKIAENRTKKGSDEGSGAKKEARDVTSGNESLPVVTSRYQSLPVVTSGYQTLPNKEEVEVEEEEKEEVEVDVDVEGKVEVEGTVEEAGNKVDVANSVVEEAKPTKKKDPGVLDMDLFKAEVLQYLEDVDEEDLDKNLRILLKTYEPDEIKKAMKNAFLSHHPGQWGYITTCCQNERAEAEIIRQFKIGKEPNVSEIASRYRVAMS